MYYLQSTTKSTEKEEEA